MNRFYIEKISIIGEGREPAIVDFCPGLNIIHGPSNSGKSMLIDCIDYAFGFTPKKGRPSKIVEDNHGYSLVELTLHSDSGDLVLKREIGKSQIDVISADPNIPSGKYSTGNSGKYRINDVFLSLLGITPQTKILSFQKGKPVSLTWRSILHLFLIKQGDVAREQSSLVTPHALNDSTSKAALLYLLTGTDASDVSVSESPEISKAKRDAVIGYIRSQREYLNQRRNALTQSIGDYQTEDIHKTISNVSSQIKELQEELNIASKKSSSIMNEIYLLNSRRSECTTLIQNFEMLYKQYISDVKRLGFIVDGHIQSEKITKNEYCPFCNTKIQPKIDSGFSIAAAAELSKIKEHLAGLELAQSDANSQLRGIDEQIKKLEKQKVETDTLINNRLIPQLQSFQQKLQSFLSLERLSGQLESINAEEIHYKSDLFEKENEEIPVPELPNASDYYSYDLISGFDTLLVEALKESHIDGADTARLNPIEFDIEINGHKKSASMGGGFCGILNTLTAMTMGKYLLDRQNPAPGFFMVDSALTQLSEAEHIAQSNTVKDGFLHYLINHADERQVIFVEQTKRMPFIPNEDLSQNIHVLKFTKDENNGRYGFLNFIQGKDD